MDLTQLLDAIREHGDIALGFVFARAAWNDLLLPLFAGYAAHLGALEWTTVIAVCWSASFLGDTMRFWIGRRWGASLIRRFPKFERGSATVLRLVDRHHLWMLLVHRYPPGLRALAGFAFGMSALSWLRFLPLNLLSSGLWAAIVVGVGYSFGHLSEQVLGQAASRFALGLLVAFLAAAWLLSKKLERVIERS
jgi:membrane protein DedA with SNARE-associated domain